MPADLEAIVAAARVPGGIQISLHYLDERMGQRDRPFPEDIIRGSQRTTPPSLATTRETVMTGAESAE